MSKQHPRITREKKTIERWFTFIAEVTMKPKGTNFVLNAQSFCRMLFFDWISVLFKKRNLLVANVWYIVINLR